MHSFISFATYQNEMFSYLDAQLISSISENIESYGNNFYIVVTCLVCKSIELSFVKKKRIILAKVILKVLLSRENDKSSVQLIGRAVYFLYFPTCSR